MTIKVDGLEMKKSLLISAYNGLLVHEVFPGRKIEGINYTVICYIASFEFGDIR